MKDSAGAALGRSLHALDIPLAARPRLMSAAKNKQPAAAVATRAKAEVSPMSASAKESQK